MKESNRIYILKWPLFLLVIGLCSCKSGLFRQPVNVMTFNIRYANPGDVPNWEQRKERVASTIRFHHIDIVGLQEVLQGQLCDLEELIPEYNMIGVGRDDGKTAGEYAPIFYLKERFRCLKSSTFWLSETPNVPGSKGWDAACTRIATWGKFHDLHTSKVFYFINTHFDHIGEIARVSSSRLILDRIDRDFSDFPVVLTGDFNCLKSDSAYSVLTDNNKLIEASTLSQQPRYGSTFTFNGFKHEINPGRQIDFIFIKGKASVGRYGIISEKWDGEFVSDHHAVVADVSF